MSDAVDAAARERRERFREERAKARTELLQSELPHWERLTREMHGNLREIAIRMGTSTTYAAKALRDLGLWSLVESSRPKRNILVSITVRITQDELVRLQNLVANSNMSRSELVRKLIQAKLNEVV